MSWTVFSWMDFCLFEAIPLMGELAIDHIRIVTPMIFFWNGLSPASSWVAPLSFWISWCWMGTWLSHWNLWDRSAWQYFVTRMGNTQIAFHKALPPRTRYRLWLCIILPSVFLGPCRLVSQAWSATDLLHLLTVCKIQNPLISEPHCVSKYCWVWCPYALYCSLSAS